MASHSTVVGGSTAGRLLACPGSLQAILALPPSVDVSSEYAEEGTFAHEVMTMLMNWRQGHNEKDAAAAEERATTLLGMHIYDRVVTQDHLDDMILPALRSLADLEQFYGGGFEVLAAEKEVRFPGVPGAFGTMDLVLGNGKTVLHADWKFGAGVPVKATYDDNNGGSFVNPQLMFYLAAAKNSARHLYYGKPQLVIAIIQPRVDEPLTHTVVSSKEVRWFVEDVAKALVDALQPNPVRVKGEHCRFAGCKINCPLWTEPLSRLGQIIDGTIEAPERTAASREVTPYGEFLAKAKTLVDIADMFKKTIDQQLHSYLSDGGAVPGWRLKAKTKMRQWVDDKIAAAELRKLGFTPDEIWQHKLQTFAKAEAAAKRLGVKIPDHLRVAPPSTETTIAQTDDPAPVVTPPLALEQFRAALAALDTAPLPAEPVAAIAPPTKAKKGK